MVSASTVSRCDEILVAVVEVEVLLHVSHVGCAQVGIS